VKEEEGKMEVEGEEEEEEEESSMTPAEQFGAPKAGAYTRSP
jgi:hypothetical protein